MPATDALGQDLTGASDTAALHYASAVADLQRFVGDPVGDAELALADSPDFAMAHVLKGVLYGLSTERSAMAVARAAAEAASRLAATPREIGHARALATLADNRWLEAGDLFAAISEAFPRDALALQAGHQIDFFTGNARMLRDRIAHALPSWAPDMPGYASILGMHAFGLEETGDYAAAEREGRRALDLEPRDGWAQHAVAHVMEMQGRQLDGIAWMREREPYWTEGSFLKVHNWWHLGLYHYELGEADAVLDLFDGPIFGGGSTLALNLVDAASLLWRLTLAGVAVGDRWARLGVLWKPKARDGNYAFNDMHAMMAFVGAGDDAAADALLAAQRDAMAGDDDNAGFTRDVGHPASLAIRAFGRGAYADAVHLLAPLPAIAHRFGGSHAQRDVIDLTLLEAALRSGDEALAKRLAETRAAARPTSPLSRLFIERAGQVS